MNQLPLELELARRFVGGGRSDLLRSTTRAALASVALGVAALVIAMALLAGYRNELEAKLVEGNAAVMIYPLDPQRVPLAEAIQSVREVEGVNRVRRVVYGQGTLTGPSGVARPVTLRGLEDRLGTDGVVRGRFGRELVSALEAQPGEVVRLAALGFEEGRPRFAFRSVEIEEVFHTGFAEFDQGWVELDLATVQQLVGAVAGELIEVGIDERGQSAAVAAALKTVLGPDFLVTDWRELNRPLFSALELQKLALFFLLGLIVVVSTFNVAATLVVMVRERWRDIGVLAALGLRRRRIAAVFAIVGLGIGATGGVIGVALGAAVSWVVTSAKLISFGPEIAAIYFLDAVVLEVQLGDTLAVLVLAIVTTFLSSLAPALHAGRILPTEALRAE